MIQTITHPDGTKTYRVRVGAGPQRTFHRRKDAEEYEEQQRRSRRRARAGLPTEQGPITYNDLCEAFLAGYDAPTKPWTEQMLAHSREKFGKQYVRAIQPDAIGAWLHSLGFAPKTKSHILERMRAVLNAGVEWGYLSVSPARGRAVRSPGAGRVEKLLPFESWDEVLKVAGAAKSDAHAAAIRFACSTGLRPGEWSSLQWRHIDVAGKTIYVPGTKTRNAPRTIPLFRPAAVALELLPRGLPHVRVFGFDYGGFRRNHWPRYLDAAGLDRRAAGQMRHTFATLALQAGVTIDVVSKWLGHSSIEITLRYYARYTQPVFDRNAALIDQLGDQPAQEEAQ